MEGHRLARGRVGEGQPEGMQGLVYLRHTASRGEELLQAATQMTEAYAEETQMEGRFVVAYTTRALWEDLDDYRQARQAAGGGVARDAGIEHAGFHAPCVERAFQCGREALVIVQIIAGIEAVAEGDDPLGCGRRAAGGR